MNNTAQIKQNLHEWRAKEGMVEKEREALRKRIAENRENNANEADTGKD